MVRIHPGKGMTGVVAVLLAALAAACQSGAAGNAAAAAMAPAPGQSRAGQEGHTSAAPRRRSLPHDQVCFANDRTMGTPQSAVTVEGRTYYGCCAGCAGRLRTDRAKRFARDPHTGREVDKATATIVLVPGAGGRVVYFESAATHAAFVARHHTRRKP